ncbi:uncharacterized protein LOC133530589 [Cydia pomonella]|uniref:uncharacterized protein LOC133530589 n=1 Tax=Cydia pomonella TaxID=82600 RepID=UPI002ADE8454|nr:uncharacterized protein LOC133530589 [Cydia pomonella]
MSQDREFKDALGTSEASGNSAGTGSTELIESTNVFKVGVKVPPFWAEEPEIWFAQVEGQFQNSGITSDVTKFNYVISHLDNQYAREVKDLIINPPASQRYDKLKTELIKRLGISNERKTKQLLMHEELGDRKPSHFFRHLKDLAGPAVPDDFIRSIWMTRLPHGVQMVLAGQPSSASHEDACDLADRVNDLASSTPKVAAVGSGAASSVPSDIAREIAELRKQFQQFQASALGRSSRSRARAPPGKRNASRQRSQSNYCKYPLCWYHGKFGDQASKCVRPCDFKPAENERGSR